jgi:uncharacterized protein YccT (UPF0319 family)
MATKKVRQSYVEKNIEMLVSLGDFENLRVGTKFGETIEWSSVEERQKKLNAITENLKREVAKDVNDVLESFELKRKSKAKISVAGRSEDSCINSIAEAEEDDEDFDL